MDTLKLWLFTLKTACLNGNCGSLLLPSITREYYNVYGYPGKRTKFKVWFLLKMHPFYTIIKLKYCEFNYCKLGTVCILDIKPVSDIWFWKLFSIVWVLFTFLILSFAQKLLFKNKVFLFYEPIYLIFLCCSCFWCHI